jgi:hypothetical protein
LIAANGDHNGRQTQIGGGEKSQAQKPPLAREEIHRKEIGRKEAAPLGRVPLHGAEEQRLFQRAVFLT